MPTDRTASARATAAALAAATPPDRDRFVDLLRVLAMAAVVVGHWLVIAVDRDGGQNLLGSVAWLHRLTWLFQVMPLVFLVGGYGNAASWASAQRRGTTWIEWFANRSRRLIRPTAVFLAVATAAAVVARVAGVDREVVDDGAWLPTIALWFLAVYVVVVAVTPWAAAVQRRWGLAPVAVLVVAAALVDAASIGLHRPGVGVANWALVWLAMTQLGVAWRDGALAAASGRRLLVGGVAGLLLLTTVGPYPISMVSVPGADVQNASPPSLALLALGLAQTGVALVTAPRARRWLADDRRWTAVVAANGVAMTVYLWHLAAVVVGAGLLRAGVFPDAVIGSWGWWLLRPLWLALLGTVLTLQVAAFSGVEHGRYRPGGHGRCRPVLGAVAVLLLAAGLGRFTVVGVGDPWLSWALFGGGMALLRLAAAGRRVLGPHADVGGSPDTAERARSVPSPA